MSADRERAFAQLSAGDCEPSTAPAQPTGSTPGLPRTLTAGAPVRTPLQFAGTPGTAQGVVRPPWAGRPPHVPSRDPRLAGASPRDPHAEGLTAHQLGGARPNAHPAWAPPLNPNGSHPATQAAPAGPALSDPTLMDVRMETVAEEPAKLTPLPGFNRPAPAGQPVIQQHPTDVTLASVQRRPSVLHGETSGVDVAAALADTQADPPAAATVPGHPRAGALDGVATDSATTAWAGPQGLGPSSSNVVRPVGLESGACRGEPEAHAHAWGTAAMHLQAGNRIEVRPGSTGSSGSQQEATTQQAGVLSSSGDEAGGALRADDVWDVTLRSSPSQTAPQGMLMQDCDQPGHSSEQEEETPLAIPPITASLRDNFGADEAELGGERPSLNSAPLLDASEMGTSNMEGVELAQPLLPLSDLGPLAPSTGASLQARTMDGLEDAEAAYPVGNVDMLVAEDQETVPEASAVRGVGGKAAMGVFTVEEIEPSQPPPSPSGSGLLGGSGATTRQDTFTASALPSNQQLTHLVDGATAPEAFPMGEGAATATVGPDPDQVAAPPALLLEPEQATPAPGPSVLSPQPAASVWWIQQGNSAAATGTLSALRTEAGPPKNRLLPVNGMLPGVSVCAMSAVDTAVVQVKLEGGSEVVQIAGHESQTCMLMEALPPMPRQPWQVRSVPPESTSISHIYIAHRGLIITAIWIRVAAWNIHMGLVVREAAWWHINIPDVAEVWALEVVPQPC
jgi:hypothetical protein